MIEETQDTYYYSNNSAYFILKTGLTINVFTP